MMMTIDTVVLAASSETDVGNFGVIFLLSGFVFYGLIYLRYRNTDKRHRHESETEATVHNLTGVDQHINSVRGVSNSKISGANNTSVRGSSNGGGFNLPGILGGR